MCVRVRLPVSCLWLVQHLFVSQFSSDDGRLINSPLIQLPPGLSSVPSMQSVSGLLYSLYRITLVDEYEYAAMAMVDGVMAPLLCGTFLAASSILCVNLLIALLTDTFQRSEVTHLSLVHQCPSQNHYQVVSIISISMLQFSSVSSH